MGGHKDSPVQDQIGAAICLMQIYIAASTMVRGEVKHEVNVLHRTSCHTKVTKVSLVELDSPGVNVFLDVVQDTAAKIVHHAHTCTSLDQRIHDM